MVRQRLARCHALWSWRRKESELDEEMRFHLAEEAEELVSDGVAPEQAMSAARRDFFDTLGVSASLGRLLTDADDKRGGGDAGPVAVISDDMWRRGSIARPTSLAAR